MDNAAYSTIHAAQTKRPKRFGTFGRSGGKALQIGGEFDALGVFDLVVVDNGFVRTCTSIN